MRDTLETCRKCNSWKLRDFGIGIDKISEEIKTKFQDIEIFEINKNNISTSAQIKKVIENFYQTKPSILISTELALPYLYKKIDTTIIASFDSLFSIPDFHIKEKIFNIMLNIKNITKNLFVIQSRNKDDSVIEYGKSVF